MNILLLNPPWYRLQDASLPYYPPGPTYIAGALEKAGYAATVYNADFAPGIGSVTGGTNILNTQELSRKYQKYLQNLHAPEAPIWQEMRAKLAFFQPDVLGISVYTATLASALRVARIAKALRPQVKIIFGGPHPSLDPLGTIAYDCVDFAIVGEGEVTMPELIRAIDHGQKDFSGIAGIVFKDNGQPRQTAARPLATDLDAIVSVARHRLYDKEHYPPMAFHMVYTARGCPYQCIYCSSYKIWGRNKRSRSAQAILEEIEQTQRDFKTQYFYLCDDIFFLKKDIPRAYEFCEGLIKRKLKILWSTQTRAETIKPELEPLLNLMRRTGGQHISVGVETGSDRISRLIKKGNTVADVREASRIIRKCGLHLAAFFMFGFPWETEAEIQQSLDLMRDIKPAVAFPYIVTPVPGTELHDVAMDMGLIPPTFELEKFYHESPEMGISANIPPERRPIIFNRVLNVFSEHNKKEFRRGLLRRWYFYFTLLKDYDILRKPGVFLGYLRDLFKKERPAMTSIQDKHVVITGASSGIGRSLAIAFVQGGAMVSLVSRNKDKLNALANELRTLRPDAKVYVHSADITSEAQVQDMAASVLREIGPVDILINNAGIGHIGRIENLSAAAFHKIFDTNVAGLMFCTKAILPQMKATGSGCIVNIASAVAYRGFPNMAIYAASKAAVKSLTEALRLEVAGDHIRVTLVSPGRTNTGFGAAAIYEGQAAASTGRPGASPDFVARQVIRAIEKNQKHVVLAEGRIIRLLATFAPFLLDKLMEKQITARKN